MTTQATSPPDVGYLKFAGCYWPSVLVTGVIPENYNREIAIADACFAWGNVYMGQEPPDNFGKGLAFLGSTYHFPVHGEELLRAAREITETADQS